ncbi:MAG: hypothetical protein KZQ88_17770 [Candidatus Thiodiazotropha sp. (ex Dulcina madagascariensis)]|nr:hypothetical protein [Candidatus Thiodiazotropha sp. (ex Dulcina madagascariensis)]MCU7925974.1 hypothetical protein [Candidatus Thiodiazotropha sp. (ex Dulcina madagascariensis)]
MENPEQQLIAELATKHEVSAYRLMDYLGISYKSGKYAFKGVFYDQYIEALKIADSSFESLIESKNTDKTLEAKVNEGELLPETKIMNGIFLVAMIIWPAFFIASLMMFDAPGSENSTFVLLAASAIWSYPVVFFIARRKSYFEANRDSTSSKSFYWSCLPFINIFWFWFMIALANG